MAIAYDTSSGKYSYNVSTTDCTFNLTAAASGSIAIMFVYFNPGTGGTGWVSSVTVGGSGATQIGSPLNISGTQYLSAYYYLNPPTSSTAYLATTVDIGADRDVEMHGLIYSDANQSGQPDSSATGTATGNLTLSTTVVASNCWLVSGARNLTAGPPGAGTGTTIRSTAYDTAFASGDSNGTVGTGSQSMQWTAGSNTTGGIILSIKPTAAAGPANVKTYDGLAIASVKTVDGLAIASVKTINGLN